jgi:hypothetical protein
MKVFFPCAFVFLSRLDTCKGAMNTFSDHYPGCLFGAPLSLAKFGDRCPYSLATVSCFTFRCLSLCSLVSYSGKRPCSYAEGYS